MAETPFTASPERPRPVTPDIVERIRAEELSGKPGPGRLRAADVVEVVGR